MHSQNVHDVLQSIRDAHRALIACAESVRSLKDDERFYRILEYCKDSEREIEKVIENVDNENSRNAMHAWTRHYLDDPLNLVTEVFNDVEIDNVDQFLELMIEAKNKILDVYDSCINGLSNPEAQEIFGRLREYELSQIQQFSRRVNDWAEGY